MSAGSVAAAQAAAIAQAIKASGVLVNVAPEDFLQIVERQQAPLIVSAMGGIFSTNYQYLSSYKGLAFFTKSSEALSFPREAEIVVARKIWIPG